MRSFCARILGWTDEREELVEHALCSLKLAATHRAALVLLGETDLVPIARTLHRRVLGADRPFVVCDPRRRDGKHYESVRSPVNYGTGLAAFQEARGGSLCVRGHRLPRDFSSVVAQLRSTDDVQLIVCSEGRDDAHPFLALPVPIRIPSLIVRTDELPRIVDEYAVDAIAELRPDVKNWLLRKPTVKEARPGRCPRCHCASRPTGSALGLHGHGLRDRQVLGPPPWRASKIRRTPRWCHMVCA